MNAQQRTQIRDLLLETADFLDIIDELLEVAYDRSAARGDCGDQPRSTADRRDQAQLRPQGGSALAAADDDRTAAPG